MVRDHRGIRTGEKLQLNALAEFSKQNNDRNDTATHLDLLNVILDEQDRQFVRQCFKQRAIHDQRRLDTKPQCVGLARQNVERQIERDRHS